MEHTAYHDDMTTKPRYMSANLTIPAASRLRVMNGSLIADTGRRITTSDLITALIDLGEAHRAELINLLNGEGTGDDDH
jgi:hypothetical protein